MKFTFDHWELDTEEEAEEEEEEIEKERERKEEHGSTGNLMAEWFSIDSHHGFVPRARKIRFAQTCAVILIPSRREYLNAGLCLW